MWLKEGKFEVSMKTIKSPPIETSTTFKRGIDVELKSPDGIESTVKIYHHEGYNRPVIEVNVTGGDSEEKVMFFLDSKGEVSRFNY